MIAKTLRSGGIETQTVGGEMRHGVVVLEEHNRRPRELADDDGNRNPPDSRCVGRHEWLAIAERAEHGPEQAEHPQAEGEQDDEEDRVSNEERSPPRGESQRAANVPDLPRPRRRAMAPSPGAFVRPH